MVISKKGLDKPLDDKFYRKTLRPDRQRSYNFLAKFIERGIGEKYGKVKSVIDYGCGAGWVLYYLFNKYNVKDITGIEPNKEIEGVLDESIKDKILFRSLKRRMNMGREFDVGVCLEVGEHIEEKYSGLIIENITKNVNVLVFSAAHPGQGGHGHVNEQPFSFWKEKIEKRDFVFDEDLTMRFKEYLKRKKCKKWYVSNISVFKRK